MPVFKADGPESPPIIKLRLVENEYGVGVVARMEGGRDLRLLTFSNSTGKVYLCKFRAGLGKAMGLKERDGYIWVEKG